MTPPFTVDARMHIDAQTDMRAVKELLWDASFAILW